MAGQVPVTVTRAHYQLVEQGRARPRLTFEAKAIVAAVWTFLAFVLFVVGVILGWLVWLLAGLLRGFTGW